MNGHDMFEAFLTDLENLHLACREFHKKWGTAAENIPVTEDQRLRLQSVWDQHEAWYLDKIKEEAGESM